MKIRLYLLTVFLIFFMVFNVLGQGDGLLIKDGKHLFPIGWYHMPKDNTSLKEMADAGINIINCNSKEALDRVHSVGIQGWMPMPLQEGVTEAFKKKVQSVAEHPALAIWEGPDEVVWNFTQYSGIKIEGSWEKQTPERVQYAREQSAKIMPNMIEAISYIRSVDSNNRQVWINEASGSEAFYVRQYINFIDITGCDNYPISVTREEKKPGFLTERWNEIGKGKPVWMILQAFSWPELGGKYKDRPPAYPSFDESRFMAYDVIARGARGIIYWGAEFLTSEDCRQSIYSLTSELNELQPFLTSPEQKQISVYMVKESEPRDQQVTWIARQFGREWMIALVNENDFTLKSVVVKGLMNLNGLKFFELYGGEEATVINEEFMTRMKSHEVKVFATGKKWETSRRNARDYLGVPVQESK